VPIRETTDDVAHQRVVADAMSAHLRGTGWFEFPPLCVADFALKSGNQWLALLEVKYRSCKSGRHADYSISHRKWHELIAEGHDMGLPVFLACHFADKALWCVVLNDTSLEVTHGGRTDRKDAHDVELMVHVPWDWFRPVTGLPGHGVVKK
jgi:hypothetical protein